MTPKTKILIVDDDEASRYVKARILARHGHQVSEAGLGGEALKIVESERPSLVLLDVRLPDVSGIEICSDIKARYPGTLVLQTSAAFTGPSDRAACLEGGADSYLIEPIEPEELVAQVGSLLRLGRAEQELRAVNEGLEQRVAERTGELLEANRRLAEESGERARMEETLRHAEKLDAIGQLTGGVAHDFNNLLTVVLGNLDAIERNLASPGFAKARVEQFALAARQAAQDAALLTRQLLAFSRRDVLRLEVIDPNEAIHGFDNLLRKAIGERNFLDLVLNEEAWRLQIDRTRLEAALLNLAVNARDAMPLGGTLSISTRNVPVDCPAMLPSQATLAVDAAAGDYVQISVADTGQGMSDGVLRHAFEPFFTTKDVGQGSGLGLSQVYGFVRQSGGFLTVETALGAGTTFHLFLPRTEANLEERLGIPEMDELPGGTETILVVEDNELVLDFAVDAIAQLGYRVLLATTPAAALDILVSDEAVDIMFSDVVLPHGMSGIELAREARRLRPALRILLTSGYSGTSALDAAMGERIPLLSKPYRLGELAHRLREVLADGAAPS
jgi:signal transduction histidine kinase